MKKIPWWEPRIDGPKEKELLGQVLKSNFPNDGDYTTQFEKEAARRLGSTYAVGVTSCTAAMFLALKALDIGHGDEVVVPDMTFIATANAVSMTGAKPVLVDVDTVMMTMAPESFLAAITSKTRAVMPVHVSGRAARMSEILKIAAEHNIYVVEDAAEAFLSKHNGRYLGTFGVMGCFSFSPPKTITMGQGGLVVTNDENIFFRLKELKDQGRPIRGTGGADIHNSVGYNFKLTNLQAALGFAQLDYVNERIARMVRNYELYRQSLRGINGFSFPGFDVALGEVPQWTDAIVERRDELDEHLKTQGIECRRFWFPIHTQAPYKLPNDNFPHSTRLSPKALWLPSAFTLTDEDIETVCERIRTFLKRR